MHVAFNQDASCIVAGTSQGFRVYNCSPFGRFYSSEDTVEIRGVGLAQMLFSTSLVVIAGNGEHDSPRRLAIVNTRRSAQFAILCELTFPTAIRAIRLNRQRLVVVLDAQIYIYNLANMKLLHTLDTAVNRSGIADVTPTAGVLSDKKGDAADLSSAGLGSSTGNWLVYPAGPPLKHHVSPPTTAGEAPRSRQGDVVVFDLETLSPVTVIRAHRSPLSVLALNEDGTLLATASDRGTLVRVFSIPSGTLLYEFRRGSFESRMYSIAFNLGSKLLCVSSATQTVHIYKLDAAHRVKHSSPADREGSYDDDADREGDDSGFAGDTYNDQRSSPENHLQDADTSQGSEYYSPAYAPSADTSGALSSSNASPSLQGSALQDTLPDPAPSGQKHTKSKSSWFSRSAWTDAARAHRSNARARDFAWLKLPLKQNTRTVLGLAPMSNLLYVATEDGKLFHYAIDMDKGGECKKLAKYVMD